MKKFILSMLIVALAMSCLITSCSQDDDWGVDEYSSLAEKKITRGGEEGGNGTNTDSICATKHIKNYYPFFVRLRPTGIYESYSAYADYVVNIRKNMTGSICSYSPLLSVNGDTNQFLTISINHYQVRTTEHEIAVYIDLVLRDPYWQLSWGCDVEYCYRSETIILDLSKYDNNE